MFNIKNPLSLSRLLFICLPTYLSIYLFIHPYVRPSIYLFFPSRTLYTLTPLHYFLLSLSYRYTRMHI
jgi:hypothetical protein